LRDADRPRPARRLGRGRGDRAPPHRPAASRRHAADPRQRRPAAGRDRLGAALQPPADAAGHAAILEQPRMKITMVGTGYVGLVTGTCLAESGNEVVCVDKDERKVATLEAGGLTIYEPGLLELVRRNRREGRLRFTSSLADGVAHGHLIFLAVGTPQADEGDAGLTA